MKTIISIILLSVLLSMNGCSNKAITTTTSNPTSSDVSFNAGVAEVIH